MDFIRKIPILFFNKNPWGYLADNRWTTDVTTTRMARSVYKISIPLGIGLITLSIIVLYIRYGTSREDRKGSLIRPLRWKLILIIALAAFVYLVNLVWRLIDRFAAQLIMNA